MTDFTQEEGHCLGKGGEEYARSHVSKNTTNLLMKLLIGHSLISLKEKKNAEVDPIRQAYQVFSDNVTMGCYH